MKELLELTMIHISHRHSMIMWYIMWWITWLIPGLYKRSPSCFLMTTTRFDNIFQVSIYLIFENITFWNIFRICTIFCRILKLTLCKLQGPSLYVYLSCAHLIMVSSQAVILVLSHMVSYNQSSDPPCDPDHFRLRQRPFEFSCTWD